VALRVSVPSYLPRQIVDVIGIFTESNVKFVHVMTSQQQRGYIRQVSMSSPTWRGGHRAAVR